MPRDDIDVQYIKVWRSSVGVIKKHLSREQVGLVIYLALEYGWTGADPLDIPPELQFPYDVMKDDVDKSIAKYRKVSAERSEAGARGGKAKAANRKKAAEQKQKEAPAEWEPPTKAEFKKLAQDVISGEDIFPMRKTTAAINESYKWFKRNNWKIEGREISNERHLSIAIRWTLVNWPTNSPELPWHIMQAMCKRGYPFGEVEEFLDCFDDVGTIIVLPNNSGYAVSNWRDALDEYIRHQVSENVEDEAEEGET